MKISASKFVPAMLAVVLAIILVGPAYAQTNEYRGFWIDAWHAGALNQAQVDKLLGVVGNPNSKGDIRNANCNCVFVQVRRNADTLYPSGVGEPYMSGISPSDFNGLQAVINAAHDTTGGKQRIEVHAWVVAFRTSGGVVYSAHHDTPTGSLTNLDNYWITRTDAGAETSDYAFDPGHPLAEEYLVNMAMDIVNNFDIDGIHYDYIRFTASNQGYNPTSVARYNARYGLTGQPAATDAQWKQWRRDQITAFVRKVYARIQSSKPWVKQSGALYSQNPSPTASTRTAFLATAPYTTYYADWDSWLQEGILDMAVPMSYYDLAGSYSADWTRWLNFEKDRHGARHMIIGPGIYLNSLSNAIQELLQIRQPSASGNYADGFCGYSYFAPYTTGGTAYGTWANFSPELVANVTPAPANIPAMPWKSSPTKGHVSGTVYDGTAWVDGATVSITGPESRSQVADGTGFYAFIELTPGTYSMTVTSSLGTLTAGNLVVTAGNMNVKDFHYGIVTGITGTVKDGMGNGVPGAAVTTATGGYSTVTADDGTYTIRDMIPGTYTATASRTSYTTNTKYNIVVTNGSSTTVDFTINPDAPVITSVSATSITADSAVITWTTNVPATSQVEYGTTRALGTYTANDTSLVTSHSVILTGLTQNRIYHYRVISANSLGQSAASSVYIFFTSPPAGTTTVIVDNTDPGWAITTGNDTIWKTGSSGTLFYGTNYRFADTSSSNTARCTWTPNLTATGSYSVYVYYPSGTNRSVKAPFRIYYNGGNVTVNVDQTVNGGQWYLLGNYNFAAGNSGYVQLSNGTKESAKVVMADAVKFESPIPSDATAPTVPAGLSASTTSTTQVQLSWQASTDASGIGGYKIYRNGTLIDATDGATTYTDFGLSPNTSYAYTVAAFDTYGNTSAQSSSVVAATFCLPITAASITCNKPVSTWQSSDAFTFTNTVGFGGQTIDHIRFVWDRNPSHTWTGTESLWTSGTQTATANPGGNNWYFHARAYNVDNVPNGQVDLGPYYCDTTAPETPTATAAKYTVSANQLSCSWTGTDPESGVAEYQYAIGTTRGGTNIKNWTSNGTSTSVTAAVSPDLALDTTCYFSVRIVNGAGATGTSGNSGGTTVARGCLSIAEARGYANGHAVQVTGRYVTHSTPAGVFIQDPDRTAAIYLPGATGLSYGNIVTAAGILGTSGLDRVLNLIETQVTGGPVTIAPLGITCSSLGGASINEWTPGIQGVGGAYNIGLLVRTYGKVTSSAPDHFYITDGMRTVKVISTANPGSTGQTFVMVTGISSWEDSGGTIVPVILANGSVQSMLIQ